MSEENINAQAEEKTADNNEKDKKKTIFTESRIELITAVFLGITALFMAWATWIGSLHGGNQATNYAKSNNLASEGNSEYNTASQIYLSDMLAWNTILDLQFEQELAILKGDTEAANMAKTQQDTYIKQNCSERFAEAASQMEEGMNSPFDVPGFIEGYFDKCNELLAQSQAALEEGQQDNSNGDAFNLVTVIYSLVLFLLGIVGIFKRLPNRALILCVSIVGCVFATVYMLTLPMPTGFDFFGFF